MRRWRTVAVGLVVVGGLTGCFGGAAEPGATASATAATSGPRVQVVEDGEGVAEFVAPGLNDYDGDVRVVVDSLTVAGETMELRLRLTPLEGDPEQQVSIYDMFDTWPELSDLEHLTKYKVLGRPNNDWQTNKVGTKAHVGEPVLYQAWFPAPREKVESLDLSIHPSWPSVLDVPVTWE